MMRFKPDSVADALTRFFDMAAPDANVYVEISAPDLRLAALVLGLIVVLALRRAGRLTAPAWALLLALVVATVPWLITTGNGRYWMPMLVLAGPVLAGVVSAGPGTRALRLTTLAGLLALQGFLLDQGRPWDGWTWVRWGPDGYYDLEVPPDLSERPANYLLQPNPSFSLIAPLFHPQSRWSKADPIPGTSRDHVLQQHWLSDALSSAPLYLVTLALPRHELAAGQLPGEVHEIMNTVLAPLLVQVDDAAPCRLLRSRSMGVLASDQIPKERGRDGFWVCRLKASDAPVAAPKAQTQPPSSVEAAFARVEQLCPKHFPAGSAQTRWTTGGWFRSYGASDTRVYVMDTGEVAYKFWRSLNAVRIGDVSHLMRGAVSMDCPGIRGNDRAWSTGR